MLTVSLPNYQARKKDKEIDLCYKEHMCQECIDTRHAVHQEIMEVKKDKEIQLAYVDKDAINNRHNRKERIKTQLIALKAYDSRALTALEVRKLLHNLMI